MWSPGGHVCIRVLATVEPREIEPAAAARLAGRIQRLQNELERMHEALAADLHDGVDGLGGSACHAS
jgi:hypothetical protein